MRTIVIALSLISVTLAGTTAHFARELQLERQRPRTTAAVMTQAPPLSTQVARTRTTPPVASTTPPPPAPPPTAGVESEEERVKRLQADHHRKAIKAFEDPRQREGMVVGAKMSMRRSYPGLAQAIGMTGEEVDRLLTLLAEQQVELQEKFSRCTLDGNCDVHANPHLNDPRAQEIAALLGTDRQQRFDTYQNTLMERESVAHLQTRLADSTRLPDGDAEALIAALADEREKIHQEAAERHAGVNGVGFGAGMIFFSSDAQSTEEKLASAQANARRMRDRAAAVLTAEQLRVFDEMQAELMISLQAQIVRKEDSSAPPAYATATIVD